MVRLLCAQQLLVDTEIISVGWEHEIINVAAEIALNNIESNRA